MHHCKLYTNIPLFLQLLFTFILFGDTTAASRTRNIQQQSSLCPDTCWNGQNCSLLRCQSCPFSCGAPETCTLEQQPNTCKPFCMYKSECESIGCSECLFCTKQVSSSSTNICPITQFDDRTDAVLFDSRSYFDQWTHSGKPYFHEGAPLFVDINGDSILDYFNSMHGHPGEDTYKRMELALSKSSSISLNTLTLMEVSDRIIFEDSNDIVNLDTHGEIIADLDGDGYLDILVSNGGERGLADLELGIGANSNVLFWGEPAKDDVTGKEYTVFRGGRNAARQAGVQMELGRGRFLYVLDVNRDGRPDLFSAQDRPVSNEVVPGILLINQGNRKWSEHRSMMEYTRAMIVTDADGDGYANEILITRGFCYPQRQGPDVDENHPDLGTFTNEVKSFCDSRPVGTTAIYRFNDSTKEMEEISKPFTNFKAAKQAQPACCQHGQYNPKNDCTVNSVASADFDNDQIADHIYLYESKMVFYFSSDRNNGEFTGDPNKTNFEIELPPYCGGGLSVRVVDFNNDGVEEIFVICQNAGVFLLYTKGMFKRDWKLEEDCTEMGDINDRFRVAPTHKDLVDFCANELQPDWNTAIDLCDKYQRTGELPTPNTSGASIYDLNNDGYLDVISTNTFGYLKFYYNNPHPSNRHIMFDLGNNIKHNAVGLTLILWCKNDQGGTVKQFREIAHYHHPIDRSGAQDDRVIFGLGTHLTPTKLELRFSNGTKKDIILSGWVFSNTIINLDRLNILLPGGNDNDDNIIDYGEGNTDDYNYQNDNDDDDDDFENNHKYDDDNVIFLTDWQSTGSNHKGDHLITISLFILIVTTWIL